MKDQALFRASERRRYDREHIAPGLRVEVASGFLAPVPGAIHNISRGGVLLRLLEEPHGDTEVPHCVVRFAGAAGEVRPRVSRGRILRRADSGGGVQLAIEFSEPLVSLGA